MATATDRGAQANETLTGTSVATGAFTPAANSYVFCVVHINDYPTVGVTMSDSWSDTGGGSWTQLGSNADVSDFLRTQVWYRLIGTSPGSGAATATTVGSVTADELLILPTEIDGLATSGVVTQADTDVATSGSSIASTLAAFGANGSTFSGFAIGSTGGSPAEQSPLVEISLYTGTNAQLSISFYDGEDTSPQYNATIPGNGAYLISAELETSAAGPATPYVTPQAQRNVRHSGRYH